MKMIGGPARVGAMSLATILLGMLVAAAPAGATNWKTYSYNPTATHPAIVGLEKMAEQIDKATNGKIKMKVSVGGSLPISATDITQAVADNVVQVGADGFFLGNIRIGGVLRLPLLLTTRDQYEKAAEIMEPYLEKALAKQGVTLLAQYLYPLQVAWSSRELKSLEDIKGQKLRVTSPEQGEFVKRFGGIPVTIGAPEVASSLQRGVVNGVFTASAGGGRIWKEMLKYNYRLGPNWFNSLIIVNTKAFDRLSDKEKQAVRKAAQDAAAWMTETMKGEESQITKELAAGGMVVTEPTQAQIDAGVAKMRDYWPQWAKEVGPEAEEALAKVRKAIGQ
ncbi:TRAP transporter substrate-binding protein DctP [Reyranella sp.]|uniref:TRAP transporter substrate-binding protein DctP n=1 Tax=Reyranella sp. TaxID=1929291 RepID=UPI003BAA0BE9